MQPESTKHIFVRLIEWSAVFFAFLLPLFFIPVASVSLASSKFLLVAVFAVLSTLLYILSRFHEDRIIIPRHGVFYAFAVALGVYGVSAIFSPARQLSLWGSLFEIDSFIFVLSLGVIAYVLSGTFTSLRQYIRVLTAFFSGVSLLAVFHVVRSLGSIFLGQGFLSLGVLGGTTANFVGKWNDVSILVGALVLGLIVIYEYALSTKRQKIIVGSLLALSIAFLVIANFTLLWWVVGIFSLGLFGHVFVSRRHSDGARKGFPIVPFVIMLISVVFIIDTFGMGDTSRPHPISNLVAQVTGVSNIEVRPSLSGTASVVYGSWHSVRNVLVGVGPARFVSAWVSFKPEDVNQTVFWDTDFTFGAGMIPTFAVTLGVVGLLAWLVFIGMLVYSGLSRLFASYQDAREKAVFVTVFVTMVYFWTLSLVYVPGVVGWVMTFFFTGLYLALFRVYNSGKAIAVPFNQTSTRSFVGVFIVIVTLIGAVIYGFLEGQRFIANLMYGQAIISAQSNDIAKTEQYLSGAVSYHKNDVYYRTLSQLYIGAIERLANNQSISKEVAQAELQNLLSRSLESAGRAVAYDKTNYTNWLALGSVYEYVVPFKIPGAYDAALSYYKEAQSRNQKSPAMYLSFARLELAKGDRDAAKNYVTMALSKKQNYTEAIYLLSQIEIAAGDTAAAIRAVEAAALLNPNDSTVFFQLGFLRYNAAQYEGAVGALERAVVLNPVYANAKYFLGLSYSKLGRVADALAQFKDVKLLNPDNVELDTIIKNLEAGKAPFAETKDTKTDIKSKLPVQETKKTNE